MVWKTEDAIPALKREFEHFFSAARPIRKRTIAEFAEACLVIPEGRYEGMRFKYDRQPFTRLLLKQLAKREYPRNAITGCVQSGKSLMGYVLVILYYTCELAERVVVALPTMKTAEAKWRHEIRPAMCASGFAHLLPTVGQGSKHGAKVEEITLRNGAVIKFMAAHGGDENRSSFTARVVCFTEVDKMDEASESSRHADPVSQILQRLGSYESQDQVVFFECTVSIKSGRIWQEYENGTASRIIVACPHCGKWQTPEREHLKGWQDANTKVEAGRLAYWECGECQGRWDDAQRREMNHQARLLHRGQELTPDGRIVGEPIETDTFGFRWNAFNNHLRPTSDYGQLEWSTREASDVGDQEKSLVQDHWASPWESPDFDETPLDKRAVARRVRAWPRGFVPKSEQFLTVGVDVGAHAIHYAAVAALEDSSLHCVQYGMVGVNSGELGLERGISEALADLFGVLEVGLNREGWNVPRIPDRVLVDAGYQTSTVFAACQRTQRAQWALPLYGRGESVYRGGRYVQPEKTSDTIKYIGDGYHVRWSPKRRSFALEINVDSWKSWLHARLAVSADGHAPLTFYTAPPREHETMARHLVAERLVNEHVEKRGLVQRWVNESNRPNHYLDALVYAVVGAHLQGFQIVRPATLTNEMSTPAVERTRMPTLADGRQYLVSMR